MQRDLKFRMPINNADGTFKEWFYWGFIFDDGFTGPHSGHRNCQSYQFIGLHDTNGISIYEGDVCRALAGEEHQGCREFDVKGVVKFLSGAFYIVDKNLNCYDFGSFEQTFVLGNTIENPELPK